MTKKYKLLHISHVLKIKSFLLLMMLVSLGSGSFTFAQNTNPGLDPVLTLSSTKVTLFSAANSTQDVTVTSNIAWTVSNYPAWLTVNPVSGSGNGTITFTAQANPGTKRVANVIVSAIGVADQIITVTQLPEIPSFTFKSSSAGALSISLQFNSSGSFYIDWGNGTQILQTASTSLTDYVTPASPAYVAGNTVKIYGIGITAITINSQSLTLLDVSQCTDLVSLDVAYNSLSTLSINNNILLNSLSVGFNNLTTLDVSNNPALTYLSCSSNKIYSLDVSKNTSLNKLYCSSNKLTSLDVSNNALITLLYCSSNDMVFSTLPQPKSTYTSYNYSPQNLYHLSANGDIVDLGNQYSVPDINSILKNTVYKWYTKPGVQLVAGTDYKESNGVFTFQNTPADSVYCIMTNAAFPSLTGLNALRTVNLKVELLLPIVTTTVVNPLDVTPTTAVVNGNIVDLGTPTATEYGICWNTTGLPDPTILGDKHILGLPLGGNFTDNNFNGLIPNTTYYVRAYATNLAGTGYGVVRTFTTGGVPPTLTTDLIDKIGITKARAYGNITDLGIPNPTQYGVVWSTLSTPTVALPTKTEQGPANTTGSFFSDITGLTATTSYYVRAYATNSAGTSYGQEQFFTTLPPTINLPVFPQPLDSFKTTIETASPFQTFIINGLLSDNLDITPPSWFEVRKKGTTNFTPTISLPPSATEIVEDTIEIRIASTAPLGDVSGIVVCSSLSGPSQNFIVKGIVKPIQLTITSPTVAPTKVYDGTTVSYVTKGTLSGVLPGDVANVTLTPTASYDNANAGIGKPVTISYSLSGTAAIKYLAPLGSSATADITPAPVIVTALTDTKPYDGTITSAVNPTHGTFVSGDIVKTNPIQVFDDANAGSAHVMTASGLTIQNGLGADVTTNYDVTYSHSALPGVITVAPLSVTAVTDIRKYDGTVISIGQPVVEPLAMGDNIKIAPVQVFDNATVGNAHVMTASGLVIQNGVGADVTTNYDITYNHSALPGVITVAPLSVTAVTETRLYNGTTSSTGSPIVEPLAMGDIVKTNPTQVFDNANVGSSHIMTASGLAIQNGLGIDVTANYDITYNPSVLPGIITPAPFSVTAATDTRMYDGTRSSSGTPVTSGTLALGDIVKTNSTQEFDNANAGSAHVMIASGLVIQNGLGADVTANYDITYNPSALPGVITQVPLSVTALTDTRVYNGTRSSGITPITAGTFASGDIVKANPIQEFDNANVGSAHVMTASGLAIQNGLGADVTTNYDVTYSHSALPGVITVAPLNVTAVTDIRKYDGTVISIGQPVVEPLAMGDNIKTSPVQVFDNATVGNAHIMTASGLVIQNGLGADVTTNYDITYNHSALPGVITVAPLNVTAVTETRLYNGTTSSNGQPVVEPLAMGDVIKTAPVQVFDNANVGSSHIMTASGLAIQNGLGIDVTANYDITYNPSVLPGIITPAPFSVTAATDTRMYNGITSSIGVPTTAGTLAPGDFVKTNPIQVFDNANAGSAHVMIASGLVIQNGLGADVTANYDITYNPSVLPGVITQVPLSVTAVTETKVYDGVTNSSGTPVTSGTLAPGDIVKTNPIQAFDNANAGSAHVLTASGLAIHNGADVDVTASYAITYTNSPATGVINKLNLTVTAVADTKIYDGTVNSLVAPLMTPLAASDAVSVAPVQVFDSPFVGSTHTLTASGLTIKDGSNADVTGNYNITYVSSPATGVIDKLVVTVTAVQDTKTYDATVNSSVVPLIGLLGIGDVPNTVPVQVYDSPNAGNTHVLSPSGLSVKNGGNVDVSANYTIIYVNTPATGIINKYNVSVTAVMDTKTYDATVASAGVPVVGVLLAGQLVKAVPTQVFDDPNAGTSHVLIPSGLTVKDGGNADVTDNYAIAYVNSPATGVINKFNVTVTAVTDTKVYDGTTVSVGVPVVGTLLVGQMVNAYPIQMFDAPEVGNTHLLIVSGLTVQNSSNTDVTGNYAINYVNSPTGVITKRDLTVTALTDSKTYDATVGSVVSPLVGALAAGDVVNAAPVQVFDTPLPGMAHVLTPSGLTIKDGSNVDATGNYRISYISSPATGIITTKVLTISDPIISTHKVLDGNTTVQVTPGVITGLAPADVGNVTLIVAANYDNPNLGTDKTITVVYSLIGSAAGNYTAPADYVIHSGMIGPMTLTLSNPSINTVKEYDGNNSVIYSMGELSGLNPADAPNVILTSSASYDNANAGTGKTITVTYGLSGSLAGNYIVPPAYTITTGVITPKSLVVVSLKITTNKVYDSTNAATFTVGDLTGVVPLDAGNVTLAGTAVYDNANAGTGKNITVSYTLSGSAIANYTVPSSYTITNGVIKAKQLTIADPVVVTNKMVDGNTSAAITTLGNIQGVEAFDANNISFTAASNYDTKNVGVNKTITVVYTLNGTAMGNYIAPVDFVITGAKISDFVVLSPLVTPTNGCEGTAIDLAYDIMTGTPTQYKITFDAATLAAGILNVSYTNLPSSLATGILSVNIPIGTKDGIYKGTLQFINELGVESPVYDFQFTINVSTDYIIPKFDDVVLIDNSSNRFVGYQWFKDGLSIHGATKQFYNDLDGLVGAYSVRLTTVDGQTLYTCSKVLNTPLAKSVSIFPSPVKKNQVSTIKLTGITDAELDGADLSVYTMQGTRVYQTSRVQKVNSINLPPIAGMYVGRVTTSRGQELQFKVIVIE